MAERRAHTKQTRRLTRWSRSSATSGQSLVEFALILPLLLLLVGGIVQYGMIFATKHSLIQVGRDVGRWAATQGVDSAGLPLAACSALATDTPPQPVTRADSVARESRLMNYGGAGAVWDAGNFMPYPDNSSLPSSPPSTQSVEVVWSVAGTDPCPPIDNTTASFVTIRLTHRAPVILPGFPGLPGLGQCDADGCFFAVSTVATYRMEPLAQP